MGPLEVRRWRRFGQDRLYVNAADGTRVGWVDVRTGEQTVEAEQLRDAFERAVAEHQEAARPEAAAAPVASPGGEPAGLGTSGLEPPVASEATAADEAEGAVLAQAADPPDPEPEPWAVRIDHYDLGARKAGAAAREQAVAEREAAPVKTFIGRVLRVRNEERAWRIGAKGEEKVAARLDRLPEGWQVLHAVPVGSRGADIDHVAIGPGGVFTINAKHHPGARVWVGGDTFMVNGHRHPYVRNSRHEARRAARLLSAVVGFEVPVTGVIAVVGAHKGFTVKSQPEDVRVSTRKRLPGWLQRQQAVLTDEQVTAIHRAARKSTTWQ